MTRKTDTADSLLPDSPFYRKTTRKVPVDVFRACMTAYEAAATNKMPGTDPSKYKISIDGTTYAFGNNPMNRGMMAVKEFLGKDQAHLHAGVVGRIMAFATQFNQLRQDERFGNFFKKEDSDGSLMISEALLDACATADFVPGTMDFDFRSLHAIAEQLHSENP